MLRNISPTSIVRTGSAVALGLAAASFAFGQESVTFCHATGSASNPYNTITTSNEGEINGHRHHEGDIIPAPAGGCPTEGGTTTPTSVPEPITMLLFGAGLAGVGYAKRRMGRKEEL